MLFTSYKKIFLFLAILTSLSFIIAPNVGAKGETYTWVPESAKNIIKGSGGWFADNHINSTFNKTSDLSPDSGYDEVFTNNPPYAPFDGDSACFIALSVDSIKSTFKVMGHSVCSTGQDALEGDYAVSGTIAGGSSGSPKIDDPEFRKVASDGVYSVLSGPLTDLKFEYYKSLGSKAPACRAGTCDDTKWQQMIYECWASARSSAASTAKLTAQAISQGSDLKPYDEDNGTKNNFSTCFADRIGSVATAKEVKVNLTNVSTSDVNEGQGDAIAALEEERDKQNSSSDDEVDTTTCSIDSMGWMICPMLNMFSSMNDVLYGWIESVLVLNPLQMFEEDGTPTAQYQNWQTIRNIANVLLVIAFLFVIFSQLTSFGIGNYGVKKMLPRIIMIAIAINVSYLVMTIMIDVVNIVGVGLHDLLDNLAVNATMDSLNATNVIGSFVTGSTLTVAGVAIGSGVAIMGGLGIGALALLALPFIVTAVLSLFAAVATLFVRNALVIVLVIISPLAIAAYVLPNTEEWFTKWRKLFISMLMLFPMAALLFAGAKFASYVILTSAQPLGALVALFIMAAPLGALPFLIKSSNSILSGVGNRLQGMAKSAKNPVQRGLKPFVDRSRAKYRSGNTGFWANKRNPNGKTNFAQRSYSRQQTRKNTTEGYEKQAEENYKKAMIGDPETGSSSGLKGRAKKARAAHDALDRQNLRGEKHDATLSRALEEKKATNPEFRRMVDTTKAQSQAKQTAVDKQTKNYATGLDSDPTLLRVAGGRHDVDPAGQIKARAYGVQAESELESKNVKAGQILGGANSEAALQAGIRVTPDGTLGVMQPDGSINTDEAAVTSAMEKGKVINEGGSIADFSAAGVKSLGNLQDFHTTPFGAQAIASTLAGTKQITASGLTELADNIKDPGEKAQFVDQLNKELAAAGLDYLGKNSIDASGKFVLGGQKGGVSNTVQGILDDSGIGGYTKQMMSDPEFEPKASELAYVMANDAGTANSFNEGLPRVNDKVLGQLAKGFAANDPEKQHDAAYWEQELRARRSAAIARANG